MSIIEWNKGFSVGVEKFDNQHKKLFKILNDFYLGVSEKNTIKNQQLLTAKLLEYAEKHFSDEEDLMNKLEYPGFTEHKEMHDRYIMRVKNYSKKLDEEIALDDKEVSEFLVNWMVSHIQHTDCKYGSFFNKHHIK